MIKHILFPDLEPEDPIDENHLASCDTCRRRAEMWNFLRSTMARFPRMEAPPFFAARMANLVKHHEVPFLFLFQRTARRLVPVFLTLILVTTFLLFKFGSETVTMQPYTEILVEQPVTQEITLERLVISLREGAEEDLF